MASLSATDKNDRMMSRISHALLSAGDQAGQAI
jgi:hypothetical protein